MNKYGIFINHRHDYRHLAGRIYDYFNYKGMDPFLDVYSLPQGNYEEEILRQVRETPYFLCVLTKDCLEGLNPDNPNDIYYKEIKTAFESNVKILVVASEDFEPPDTLPDDIVGLLYLQRYPILNNMRNFFDEMDRICKRDIDLKKLYGVINWREYTCKNANVLISSRFELERNIASLNNRFGEEFVQSVTEGKPFTGQYRIKHINMSCYAASILFAPDRYLVDYKAYDHGMMFNIFSYLLQDDDFSMTIITNSPDSYPAIDAIERSKLGNSSLEENQKAVFLSSYANVTKLMTEEPYKTAKRNKKFRYLVTEAVLPFAYFQIIYKKEWEEFNHIKIDLYTEGLESSSNRRSMLIFERGNEDSYRFLESQFEHLRERELRNSNQIIKKNNDVWLSQWEEYLAENE